MESRNSLQRGSLNQAHGADCVIESTQRLKQVVDRVDEGVETVETVDCDWRDDATVRSV